MATWTKKPFKYTLIGLEQGSAAKPYEIVITEDTRDGRRWVSCNCPSYIRGRQNQGLQQWERSCKHTVKYSVNAPEVEFDSPNAMRAAAIEKGIPVVTSQKSRIGFVKPMLPARWEDRYTHEVFDNPLWTATLKVDGHRCMVVRQPYGTIEMFSRGGKRMMEVEPSFQDLPISTSTMLDCELTVADLSTCRCDGREDQREAFEAVAHFRAEHPEALKLIVLDILFSTGDDVRVEPYWFRRDQAASVVKHAHDPRLEMVWTKPNDLTTEEWIELLNGDGAEGIVFWNVDETYSHGTRSSLAMRKWKPGRVDHQEVVVVGILPPTEKGTLHRLAYGYADGKQVGVLPGIQGEVEELEQYVGMVAELSCHEVLPSGALLYPDFIRWREDKTKEECIK